MSKLTFDIAMATWRHVVECFCKRVIFGDDDFTGALICSTFYQWYHRGNQQIGLFLDGTFFKGKIR